MDIKSCRDVHFRPTPIFALFFLLSAIFFAPKVNAHPNGVSKITIHIEEPDSILLRIDFNRDDVLNIINEGNNLYSLNQQTTKSDYLRVIKKAAYYVQSRLRLEIDGAGLSTLKPVAWDSTGKTDTTLIDSADVFAPTYVLSFATRIPSDAKKLTLGVQLFLEFGIQPLSEVTVLWHDKLVQKAWLSTDKFMHIPLNRDSLAARIARDTGSVATSGNANIEGGLLRFIGLGFLHILPRGVDHILFVLGLFFFSTLFRPLLWQITAFTLAHSLTLGLSLLGLFTLPAKIVEPLIALSIAVIAIENIFYRKLRPSRWIIVFGFGLVHGLGFAGVLHQLGVPKGEFWSTLIGFNLGVELGQITIVAGAALLTFRFWKKTWYFKRVVVPISLVITCIGLYWAVQRAFF